jgi:hypothetical protein
VVTTLVTERFEAPSGRRGVRRLDLARRRVLDELAGRTVWNASALPRGREAAEALGDQLGWTREGGVAEEWIGVPAGEPIAGLARRLDAKLRGSAWVATSPERADRETYAEATVIGDALVARGVALDDVVVLHDPLAPALAHAIREQGAHAVWQVSVAHSRRSAVVTQTWAFLRAHAAAVDAYLMTWTQPAGPGLRLQHVAALMPSPGLVSAKEIDSGQRRGLGWGSALADVVHWSRSDRVGGTLHARPAVPSR